MRNGITIRGTRADVYVRETAPGVVIASWYPRDRSDVGWPGALVDLTEHGFPRAALDAGDVKSIRGWIDEHFPSWLEPGRPPSPREEMIERRARERDRPTSPSEEIEREFGKLED